MPLLDIPVSTKPCFLVTTYNMRVFAGRPVLNSRRQEHNTQTNNNAIKRKASKNPTLSIQSLTFRPPGSAADTRMVLQVPGFRKEQQPLLLSFRPSQSSGSMKATKCKWYFLNNPTTNNLQPAFILPKPLRKKWVFYMVMVWRGLKSPIHSNARCWQNYLWHYDYIYLPLVGLKKIVWFIALQPCVTIYWSKLLKWFKSTNTAQKDPKST